VAAFSLNVSFVARWMCCTIATSTTLTLFRLLKEEAYSSLKILNILRKVACEGRRMVQNLFYFRRLNTSVCRLHACYKRCVLAWNIWGYVMYIQLSSLRKSGPSDCNRFHADRWMGIYDDATSRFSILFQMRLKFLPSFTENTVFFHWKDQSASAV